MLTLVYNSTAVRQISIGLQHTLAAIFGFRIWSTDVNDAYLQSASQLLRDFYLKPGKEFELPGNQLLHLLRPLYGLADSSDCRNETFTHNIKNEQEMQQIPQCTSFFIKKAGQ